MARAGLALIATIAAARGSRFDIDLPYAEGEWVGAGEPLVVGAGQVLDRNQLPGQLLDRAGALLGLQPSMSSATAATLMASKTHWPNGPSCWNQP